MSKLAILGGEPVRKKPFEYYPNYDEKEKAAVNSVLESRLLSGFYKDYKTGGPKLQEFEKDFANYHNTNYAIGVNSGTAALHAGLVALGIKDNDEVLVPSYTFTSSASSILMCNATPIFCDVDENTLNIDTKNLESLISEKTKAIMAVHLLGNPCDMNSILDFAKKNNLKVLEDCAQSPGAKYENKLVGTFGDISCFSFVETKNIVTGEGGMIITNNKEYNNILRLVRSHGEVLVDKGRSYLSSILGWNYRMTEIEAAIGIEQLKKMDSMNQLRINNAKILDSVSNLNGLSKIITPGNNSVNVYHAYALLYDKNISEVSRDILLKALNAEGIEVDKGYPHPLYLNPIFLEDGKGIYKKGLNPVAEKLCFETAIWIRKIMHPNNEEDMKDIVNGFEKVFENLDDLRNMEK